MPKTAEIPFHFEVPLEAFEKAGEKGKERRIGGIISTECKDRQGEVVLQRGLDFSEFLKNGWFNDNHGKGTTDIVGYPTSVEMRSAKGKPAHYVEGYLLKGHEPSDRIWELANSLQKTNRRLGFSIEGSVVRRDGLDGKTIAKAKVRNVALTNCPVNDETTLEIVAKSMMALEAEAEAEKSMAAGQAINAPAPAPGEGFPLRTESTERLRTTTYKKKKKKKKKLSKSEAVAFLQTRYPGLAGQEAERIFIFAVSSAKGEKFNG